MAKIIDITKEYCISYEGELYLNLKKFNNDFKNVGNFIVEESPGLIRKKGEVKDPIKKIFAITHTYLDNQENFYIITDFWTHAFERTFYSLTDIRLDRHEMMPNFILKEIHSFGG